LLDRIKREEVKRDCMAYLNKAMRHYYGDGNIYALVCGYN